MTNLPKPRRRPQPGETVCFIPPSATQARTGVVVPSTIPGNDIIEVRLYNAYTLVVFLGEITYASGDSSE